MRHSFLLFAAAVSAIALAACGDDGAKSDAPADKGDSAAAVATTSESSTASAARPFKVKSGIVESTIDLMGEQKQTIYFDDYGTKQAIVTSMEMMGQKSESITINADGWTITYDPAKKEGTKRKAAIGATTSAVPDLSTLSDATKERYKLKEIENREIVGKDAEGYSMEAMGMPMKVWIWEGIPMRTEVTMSGDKAMVTEVKNLQVDVAVPADRFVVPADVKLTEM